MVINSLSKNKIKPIRRKKADVTLLYKPVGNKQPPWRWNVNSPLGQATADINIQNKNVKKQSSQPKYNAYPVKTRNSQCKSLVLRFCRF
jgi:hypothetical protein